MRREPCFWFVVRHRDVRTLNNISRNFEKGKKIHKPEVTNRYSQSIRLITSSEVVDPVGAPAITFPEAIPGTPRIRTRFEVYYPFPSR